jgi:hypothetical protein
VSTFVWILVWTVALCTLAFFAIREIRSGRKGPGDFDRMRHDAVGDAASRAQMTGPGTAPF